MGAVQSAINMVHCGHCVTHAMCCSHCCQTRGVKQRKSWRIVVKKYLQVAPSQFWCVDTDRAPTARAFLITAYGKERSSKGQPHAKVAGRARTTRAFLNFGRVLCDTTILRVICATRALHKLRGDGLCIWSPPESAAGRSFTINLAHAIEPQQGVEIRLEM